MIRVLAFLPLIFLGIWFLARRENQAARTERDIRKLDVKQAELTRQLARDQHRLIERILLSDSMVPILDEDDRAQAEYLIKRYDEET